MSHPLVDHLRFARLSLAGAVEGCPEEDAIRRIGTLNSIGWDVAHMAWHEQVCWLTRAQALTPEPRLNELAATGGPASTPPLAEALAAWRRVTVAVDPYLDALRGEDLLQPVMVDGVPWKATQGTWLQRMTYHYWFHIGEVLAARQVLGHPHLPAVGDLVGLAPYRPPAD